MKIQVDLDGELWAKFRAKVHQEGKTLGSVVPTIFEPALRVYLEPEIAAPPLPETTPPTTTIETDPIEFTTQSGEKKLVSVERLAPPLPTVKRCDLCDQVVDRLFASAGKRVCYTCWRSALTAGQ